MRRGSTPNFRGKSTLGQGQNDLSIPA